MGLFVELRIKRRRMEIDRAIKILLVEDSKMTRKLELKVLNDLGFTNVVEANDGDEAIARLVEHADTCLIISDWNMPNKDGFELLKWVRSSDESNKTIPFVMATARGEKKENAKAADAGVTSFITKPFGPPELNAVIEKIFGGKEMEGAEAKEPERPRLSESGKLLLNVAHIQITDHLGLGVLKNLIAANKVVPNHFDLQTRCMGGWNPVQQALESGEVDAAFVLAPIAMDLFGFGVPIKMVLLAHKNGSICVRKKTGSKMSLQESFRNKCFYIPHAMSIHHMLSHMFLREIGLNPGVQGKSKVDVSFEVVPPIKMPEMLANNPDACGFTVAEPMGTKAIAAGFASQLFLTGELWENHPCCILAVRDEIINEHPDALQEFTSLLVQAGDFIRQRPESAAEIALNFLDPDNSLGLKLPILRSVLTESRGIRTSDLLPSPEDFERIQKYMVNEMGIGSMIDVGKFVDTRFAEIACRGTSAPKRKSSMRDLSKAVEDILEKQRDGGSAKNMLGKEGKYLFFTLDSQEYGIEIFSVKEVIRMMPVRPVPQTPPFFKGVINLRDKVIPIMDLRIKFGKSECEYGERACIIILEIPGEDRLFHFGIAVDSVSEVVTIKAQDTEEPKFLAGCNTSYILAMAKINNTAKLLLNASRLFSESETEAARNAA
jgi:chemotaxis signal transduction protein/ABC-type nitrate/sulfonate/bicarbonate transport system substrate-binding protein/DNA-binding response OmpR family regulator